VQRTASGDPSPPATQFPGSWTFHAPYASDQWKSATTVVALDELLKGKLAEHSSCQHRVSATRTPSRQKPMSMSVGAPEYQVPAGKVPVHVDRATAMFCPTTDGGSVVIVAAGTTTSAPVQTRVSKFGELPANPPAPVTSPTAGVLAELGAAKESTSAIIPAIFPRRSTSPPVGPALTATIATGPKLRELFQKNHQPLLG
jgi:hypothetical protein